MSSNRKNVEVLTDIYRCYDKEISLKLYFVTYSAEKAADV
jgi:hypothetical protein